MANPLSPVFANIFMAKLEANVVRSFNLPFYYRYAHDCFSKKKKNEPDKGKKSTERKKKGKQELTDLSSAHRLSQEKPVR